MYYLGIDLGGTNIVAGVVDEDGNILVKASCKTNAPRPEEELCDDMAAVALKALESAGLTKDDISFVGIGAPGAVNGETGIIEFANNFGYHNWHIVDMMKERLGVEVYVENDANAAAYGEYQVGAAKDANDAVVITLGTGVGGGIIINGKILAGTNGAGGEIGHITIDPDETDICNCGKKGCLEQYASATGIVRMANKLLNETDEPSRLREVQYISAKEIYNAAKSGDKFANDLVEEIGRRLGFALASIACVVDPEIFVIGGGVSRAGSIVTNITKKYYQQYAFHACKNADIVLAKLGNDAGMYGGACAVIE